MSSLAAARADNFYYPPEYDPSKHGSLNQFRGQHPLRERAKKIDQGILVIRFEVPFNIWCEKCGEMIAKGVRFNAEKKQVGSYYSTKIWSFSMRHHCGCTITIQTDPKNAEYLVTEGARKKVEEYTAADAETVELPGNEEKATLDDPIARLEHATAERQRAKRGNTLLEDLLDLSHATAGAGNDFQLNRALRGQLRAAKKADAKLDERRKELHLPDHIKLLPESAADAEAATVALFDNNARFTSNWKTKRKAILSESIFPAGSPAVPLQQHARQLPGAAAPGQQPKHRPRAINSSVPTGSLAQRPAKRKTTDERAVLLAKRQRTQ